MQITSINNLTNFGATISMTEGYKKIRKFLIENNTYDKFCKNINKELPNKTDIVSFNKVELRPDSDKFSMELAIDSENSHFNIYFLHPNKKYMPNVIMDIIKWYKQNKPIEKNFCFDTW